MPEKNAGDGGGSPLNLTSILALVTLLGGTFLISQKLSSDRPVASADKRPHAIGSQTLEARLWEDPFRSGNHEKDGDIAARALHLLEADISAHLNGSTNKPVLLMPVMLPGGSYGEDHEGRIRSRMAVVSALGCMGYAPDDAEHVGVAIMPWPTTLELRNWKTNANASFQTKLEPNSSNPGVPSPGLVATMNGDFKITNSSIHGIANVELLAASNKVMIGQSEIGGGVELTHSTHLHLYYEWYRPRVFFPRAPVTGDSPPILVIWLDDSFFEDDPLVRLPLLFRPLLQANGIDLSANTTSQSAVIRLIGPRRSSTLRAMLPEEFKDEKAWVKMSGNLKNESTNILQYVAVYSSTASVMDEVLVEQSDSSAAFRKSVTERLQARGFKEFHFFNVTDAQLAEEVFSELELRNVSLTNLSHHLVLISESDTFYGRMLSLTYGAALALRQTDYPTAGRFLELFQTNNATRNRFVELFQKNGIPPPSNLHSFAYLRGLDGQTVSENAAAQTEKQQRSAGEQSRPNSFEDLLKWQPNANRAEGQAQFDYLSRLGKSIESLQQRLQQSNSHGEIKAIGIIGSDVYDTLLILQALRDRFPKALFFTTDLDARYWDPKEQTWARNLIVASSYGLALHPDLQKEVAPFRDSSQTAQFAAVLAALGNTSLAALTNITPRRFEIGNRVAVELSRNQEPFTSSQQFNPTNGPWLHPLTRVEEYKAHSVNSYWETRWNQIATALVFLTWLILWHRQNSRKDRMSTCEIQNLTLLQSICAFVAALVAWIIYPPNISTLHAHILIFLVFLFAWFWLAIRKKPISGEEVQNLLLWKPLFLLAVALIVWIYRFHLFSTPGAELLMSLAFLFAWFWLAGRGSPAHGKARTLLFLLLSGELAAAVVAHVWSSPTQYAAILTVAASLISLGIWFWLSAPRHWIENLLYHHEDIGGEAGADWLIARVFQRSDPFCQTVATRFRNRYPGFQKSHANALVDLLNEDSEVKNAASVLLPAPQSWLARVARSIGLWQHFYVRRSLDSLLDGLSEQRDSKFRVILQVIKDARKACRLGYKSRAWSEVLLILITVITIAMAAWMAHDIYRDTLLSANGEPFSLVTGASAWLGLILRSLGAFLSVIFIVLLISKLRATFFSLTREYYFPLETVENVHPGHVSASELWKQYREEGEVLPRLLRGTVSLIIYVMFGFTIAHLLGFPYTPGRGSTIHDWTERTRFAFVPFLFLSFLAIDEALLCHRFIKKLGARPTDYPETTLDHFRAQRGNISKEFLDEWIDVRLIADLTEQVGRLLWFPSIVFLVMLAARNQFTDHWPWSSTLTIMFAFNFFLAIISVVIVQQTARKAKKQAQENLAEKVKRVQASIAPSAPANNAAQAKDLLDEINSLHRGAFARPWENPVFGAILLPSGATVFIQLLMWLNNR